MLFYGRLSFCFIFIPVAFGALVHRPPVDENLPGALGRFIDECFERNSRTLYLVGLEQLHNYRSYLALPYPKLVIPKDNSIGCPDESALVVMYLSANSRESLRKSMAAIMQDYTEVYRNGKYLVLMEDYLLAKPHVVVPIELGLVFATYNIVHWCVTGYRRAENLQYTVLSALNFYYMEYPVQYGSLYEWDRGWMPNVSQTINAQATLSFPYTYRKDGGSLRGIDVDIFKDFLQHFNFQLEVHIIGETTNITKDRERITSGLQRMLVDVMMTRKDVLPRTLPLVYVSGVSYYCLIVPRSTALDLIRSLRGPFSSELWICVIVAALLICGLSELAKRESRMALFVRRVFLRKPMASFLTSFYEIVQFVLVESYLAKVTCFFLVYRFQPDAKTLDEFFATGMPIRLPIGYERFVKSLGTDVRSRILERAVPAWECAEFSSTCADIASFAYATYAINNKLSVDPVSGRKPFYIVPEMLTSYSHMAYAFARGSTMVDLFAVYLRRMDEAGLVQFYHRRYEQYLRPDQQYHTSGDESLEFGHFMSVWICLSLGWVVSFAVFVLELFPYSLLKEKLCGSIRQVRSFHAGQRFESYPMGAIDSDIFFLNSLWYTHSYIH
uniref:Ionotropic glutamate receptor L-glutamate and glycine-binding domain-containing protein n=1 Tax=Anopheles atroparvus TaxID=41427 RepID=A0A182IP95_ANOAO